LLIFNLSPTTVKIVSLLVSGLKSICSQSRKAFSRGIGERNRKFNLTASVKLDLSANLGIDKILLKKF
jgi:hypothetical protein